MEKDVSSKNETPYVTKMALYDYSIVKRLDSRKLSKKDCLFH